MAPASRTPSKSRLKRRSVESSFFDRVAEPVSDFGQRYSCSFAASGPAKVGLDIDRQLPQFAFQVVPPKLDWIQLRAVRRQVDGDSAGCRDQLPNALHLVDVEIVHHDDVAALQRR